MKRTQDHSGPMPLFVLANIARGGLQSLYELQKGVRLQPGAIHPVLRRLEQDGMLHRSPQDFSGSNEIAAGDAFDRRLILAVGRGVAGGDEERATCHRVI